MSISRKAQALSYDFFIAMAIFLAVLTVAFSYLHHSMAQVQEVRENNQAANTLFLASDVWFREGYPKYWGTVNILEIGLANNNKINQTKMDILPQLGYSRLVSLLNLGIYNLQYSLYNKSNDIIFQFPASVDMSSAKNVYNIERIGILNEQPVKIRTIIWD